MRCQEVVRLSRKRGRDLTCPPSDIERAEAPKLSYGIAFADLHETTVHTSLNRPYNKLKEVSMTRCFLSLNKNMRFLSGGWFLPSLMITHEHTPL